MKRRGARTLACLAAAASVVLLLPASVAAHRLFDNANGRGAFEAGYPVQYQNVLWSFATSFPSTGQRGAVRRGSEAWNSLGRRLRFDHDSRSVGTDREFDGAKHYCSSSRPPMERDGRPLSAVFWEPLASDRPGFVVLARAGTCYKNGALVGFRMALNATLEDWYYGADARVPSGRHDMQSTSAHEFGHAAGWLRHYDGRGQIDGSEPCQRDNPNRETMCAINYRGQARDRTLARHDRHTFEGVYGR